MLHTSASVADELIEMRGLRFHYRDWPPTIAGAPDLVLLTATQATPAHGTRLPRQ